MSKTISVSPAAGIAATDHAAATAGPQPFYSRYFFVGMAMLFLLVTALGFGPRYGAMVFGAYRPPGYIHLHGAIMLAWLLLFIVQTVLAAAGRLQYHRQLGLLSVALGVVVWCSMVGIAFHQTVVESPPVDSGAFDILAVSLYVLAIFGWFFTWAILARRNAAVHKRLFLLAMIPLMHPSIGRIPWLPTFGIVHPHAWYVHVDALLIPLFCFDWATARRIHRITWIGSGAIIAAQLLALAAWGAPAWHRFAFDAIPTIGVRLPEITLSAAQSDPLLGDYGGKDWKMTVSRENGKLYLTLPAPAKSEMRAYSETDLYLVETDWKLHFVKDEEGRVTKVINTNPGKTWEAERLR